MEEYIKENNLDEIDAFLMKEFGIMGGCCASQKELEYNVARQVAEKLWKKEEPVSEDLDFQTFCREMDVVFSLPSSKTKNTEEEPLNWEYAIAKHFANWQREQMMKDAVDGKVVARFPLASEPCYVDAEIFVKYAQNLNEGDKVKAIIIRED